MADGLNAELVRRLRETPGLEVKPGEPLARHNTFRIGGPAELLVEAENRQYPLDWHEPSNRIVLQWTDPD